MTQTPDGGGMRFNGGKVRYSLIPESWTRALAEVLTRGAEKYAPKNWERGMNPEFMIDSLSRHLAAYRRGERFDPESGNHHLAHAAWNALALMTYDLRGLVPDEFFEKDGPTSQGVEVVPDEEVWIIDRNPFPHPTFWDEKVGILYWDSEEACCEAHDLLEADQGFDESTNRPKHFMFNSSSDELKYKQKFPSYFKGLKERGAPA